jgi:hypothetical protein
VIAFFIIQIGYASFNPIDRKRLQFPQKKLNFFISILKMGLE